VQQAHTRYWVTLGYGWQFGDVGEIHPLFLQLTAAAGAEVQGYRYFYGQLSDLFRAGRLSEGEGALTRLATRTLGLAYPGAFGKGGCLALALSGEPVHLGTEVLDLASSSVNAGPSVGLERLMDSLQWSLVGEDQRPLTPEPENIINAPGQRGQQPNNSYQSAQYQGFSC
jgi:hypothetical protein